MTVYLDVLFMVNFLMDSIIISLTYFLTRRCFKLHKIMLYAAGIAVYGCGMFIQDIAWLYVWPCRILMTLGYIYLIFKSRSLYTYLKDVFVFFLSNFCLVGSIYALTSIGAYQKQIGILFKGNAIYLDIRPAALLIGIGITYLLLWGLKKIYILNFSKEKILFTISITLNNQTEKFVVLLDSGCSAVEPITGRPLLVLGKEGKKFLSQCFLDLPYIYADGISSLKGFYPDEARIEKSRFVLCEKICVGIGNADFGNMPYQGVINPDAIRECIDQYAGKGERKIEKEQQSV